MPPVRGREVQLAQMSMLLYGVTPTQRSKVLLVEGAPGIGKTRLLMEAAAIAERKGFAVASGVPAEIGETRTWLGKDAKRLPTMVALDDLQLASCSSLAELCDLIVASSDRPILWLLAFTSDRDTGQNESLKTSLGKLRGRVPVEPLRDLEPLSGDALAQLVADLTGAVPSPALLALADSLNGTPRAVIDLVQELMTDGDICTVDGTSRLQPDSHSAAPAGLDVCTPPPVPKRFSTLMQEDLRSLSAPTMTALRLAAVLGSPCAPEDLSALLGEGPVGLLAAVDEAVSRRLLVCGEHDLAFRSEPIWRVLLDSVPPPVCALLRRQAAEILLSRPDGLERVALQLVHIVKPGNTEELRLIAEGAQRLLATDPSTAASLATRCLALLPPGQADYVRLAKIAVEAFTRAGKLDRAIALATDTIEESAQQTPPGQTAFADDIAELQASMSTALLLLGDIQLARQAAGAALATQEGCFERRGEAVITHLATSYLTGDNTAVEQAQKILRAPDYHTQAVQVGAMTFQALGQWHDGRVGDSVATLREAVALDRWGEDVQLLDPRWFLAFALTRTDEYEEAEAVVQSFVQTATAEVRTLADAVPAVLRAPLHLAQGHLDEAEKAARIGAGTDGPCVPMLAPQAWLVLAQIALRRGALPLAGDHLKTLEKNFPHYHSSSPWWASHLLLKAQLTEAQADSPAAIAVLAEIGVDDGALRELVLEDPAAAPWFVRCALAADRPDVARTVIDTTEYLRNHNQQVPAVLAAAMHARALAEGDLETLAEAGRLHRNPWARATAAEDHAGLLLTRGDHKTAISELDGAMSAYAALGGERDAARVRAHLRRLGVRRRHWTHAKRPASGWDSLTKTERKVAELVASGLTNQQAASRLFISPHTVGFHLRQIYRKLGIRSRTALALVRFKPSTP
ncbi:LuxR family transcriptional regulator [Kribbella antibiotica]|nr:LuxR family transcriptional regulator [Kribbella antibiotica]